MKFNGNEIDSVRSYQDVWEKKARELTMQYGILVKVMSTSDAIDRNYLWFDILGYRYRSLREVIEVLEEAYTKTDEQLDIIQQNNKKRWKDYWDKQYRQSKEMKPKADNNSRSSYDSCGSASSSNSSSSETTYGNGNNDHDVYENMDRMGIDCGPR